MGSMSGVEEWGCPLQSLSCCSLHRLYFGKTSLRDEFVNYFLCPFMGKDTGRAFDKLLKYVSVPILNVFGSVHTHLSLKSICCWLNHTQKGRLGWMEIQSCLSSVSFMSWEAPPHQKGHHTRQQECQGHGFLGCEGPIMLRWRCLAAYPPSLSAEHWWPDPGEP